MTLTTDQIETLYAFTRKKFVPWYDLQVELVDHLAERITEEMQKDKKLNFEKALAKVYAGFGIFGFAEIVRERAALLQKEADRQLWREIKSQFNLQNLLKSIAIFSIMLFAALNIDLFFVATGSILVLLVDLTFFRRFRLLRMQLHSKKKLMVMQHLPLLGMGSFLYLQFLAMRYLELFDRTGEYSNNYRIYFAVFMFIGVIGYIAARKVTENIYFKARKEYPEAFS